MRRKFFPNHPVNPKTPRFKYDSVKTETTKSFYPASGKKIPGS